MQLFIDANIYLDYFRQSSERLQSLKALKKLLFKKKLTLLVPTQVKEEYLRNKEKTVEDSRKTLLSQITQFGFNPPTLIKEWREAKNIRKYLEKINKIHKNLVKKYDQEIEKETSQAEILIQDLFSIGKELKENKDILDKAFTRYLKGNPPRKSDNSYGDAIIWGLLLKEASGDDLSIISRDGDFSSIRKKQPILRVFLQKEWKDSSSKRIKLFTSLGEFINDFENKPTIKKEIIEKEKAPLDHVYPSVNLQVTSPGIGTTVVRPISLLDSYLEVSPRYSRLGGLSNIENPFGKEINFCPYCGKDISSQWREYISRSGGFVYNILNSPSIFVCPHCNKNID